MWGRGEEGGREVVGQLDVGECLGGRISPANSNVFVILVQRTQTKWCIS